MKAKFHYQVGTDSEADEIKAITLEPVQDHFQVMIEERVYTVAVQGRTQGGLDLVIDGQQVRAYLAQDESQRYVAVISPTGQPLENTWVLKRPTQRREARNTSRRVAMESGRLEASMPGVVLEVLVSAEDEVNRGDTLVVLEAMKMESRILAPEDGRVVHVYCSAGQVVERGQVLLEMKAHAG